MSFCFEIIADRSKKLKRIPGEIKCGGVICFPSNSPYKTFYFNDSDKNIAETNDNEHYKDICLIIGGELMSHAALVYIDEILDYFDTYSTNNCAMKFVSHKSGKRFPICLEDEEKRIGSIGYRIFAHRDSGQRIMELLETRKLKKDV